MWVIFILWAIKSCSSSKSNDGILHQFVLNTPRRAVLRHGPCDDTSAAFQITKDAIRPRCKTASLHAIACLSCYLIEYECRCLAAGITHNRPHHSNQAQACQSWQPLSTFYRIFSSAGLHTLQRRCSVESGLDTQPQAPTRLDI